MQLGHRRGNDFCRHWWISIQNFESGWLRSRHMERKSFRTQRPLGPSTSITNSNLEDIQATFKESI